MYQQLWGYKVEEKLYLGVREQKRLNTTGLGDLPYIGYYVFDDYLGREFELLIQGFVPGTICVVSVKYSE
jgi:hypothetical protein